MPVPKRYFHLSQEINSDPEMWAFTQEFGDRAIRTWLQILAYLDRSQNHWKVSGDWLATLSRTVRQSSANCSRQIGHLVATGWLEIAESSADGSPLVFKASNWSKYNRTQEHKRTPLNPGKGAVNDPLLSLPSLSLPKKEEKRPLRATIVKDEFFIELKKNPAYAHIDMDRENGKMDAWLALPANRNRIKTRKFVLNWLNKIEAPLATHQPNMTCQERVQRGNFLKPCGNPSVSVLNGRPLCSEHHAKRTE
jgi:hypothetical protein